MISPLPADENPYIIEISKLLDPIGQNFMDIAKRNTAKMTHICKQ